MTPDHLQSAQALLDFIDVSPSPWHAVAVMRARLEAEGFTPLDERSVWALEPGGRHYVIRDGSSIIAFIVGQGVLAENGFRVIGAHTDSPGFRVKPSGAETRGRHAGLGVEVYGGPIVATFADRDLTLAGRVMIRKAGGDIQPRLYHNPNPLLRLPNPAIHLNRAVNTDGLKFDAQEELPLILGTLREELPPRRQFLNHLAGALDVEADAVVAWELAVADTQRGSFFGLDQEFIADSQLDNLASCHAGLESLLAAAHASDFGGVALCAFFDHEEIGSRSFKGAEGSFLPDALARIAESLGTQGGDYQRALAGSLVISADMAHAFHPNFARYYDSAHQVDLNGGPVIKINANQRYATDGIAEAVFETLCREVEVPCQKYVHRNDLPCGSTIGPITAARIGIRCVDAGNAMWSMHSVRESAGARDHALMISVMTHFLRRQRLPF
ncbi:MAG: M18 family aminopeptidase [Aquisalimonadaceae bacterium]